MNYQYVNNKISDTFNISQNNILENDNICKIYHQLAVFATLSNFISLKGGAIKREQMLSGDMADFLSNLYFIKSVVWYEKYNCVSKSLCNYIVKRLLNENQYIINRLVDNMNYSILFSHFKKLPKEKYDINIFETVKENKEIINTLKEDIYIDNISNNLELLNTLENNDYNTLYNKVISVGENNIN